MVALTKPREGETINGHFAGSRHTSYSRDVRSEISRRFSSRSERSLIRMILAKGSDDSRRIAMSAEMKCFQSRNTFIRQHLVGELLVGTEIAQQLFVRQVALILLVIIRLLPELCDDRKQFISWR